jgi:hypothetical protein
MSSRDVDRSLELARQVFAPSAQHRERVLARLSTSAAPGGPATAAERPASSAVARRASRSLVTRWPGVARAGLLVGAGFALGYWFAEARQPQQPVALASAPVADTTAAENLGASARPPAARATNAGEAGGSNMAPLEPRAPVEPPATAREAGATRAAATQPRAHAARSRMQATEAPGDERFGEELALLQRAERAIRMGNGPLARSFIADLEARFPRTALRQERAAVLVLAACAAHEPDAIGAARAFVARHPNSVYIDRIRDACALDPSLVTPPDARGTSNDTPKAARPDGSPSHGH